MNLRDIQQEVYRSCLTLEHPGETGEAVLQNTLEKLPKIAGVWKKVPLSTVLEKTGTMVSWSCDAISHPQDKEGNPLEWAWEEFSRTDFLPVGNAMFNWTWGQPPFELEGKKVFVDAYVIFDRTCRNDLLSLSLNKSEKRSKITKDISNTKQN